MPPAAAAGRARLDEVIARQTAVHTLIARAETGEPLAPDDVLPILRDELTRLGRSRRGHARWAASTAEQRRAELAHVRAEMST